MIQIWLFSPTCQHARSVTYNQITWQKGKNMSDLPVTNKKKSFHINLKSFSLRAKYTKYFLYFILIIMLLIPLFGTNYLLKAATRGQYVQSLPPSFSFTAGGDIGGNSNSSTALDLIAQSGSQFHLAIGDLSYSEISPESAWCSYVKSRVGSTFPFELLSGNHEDGGEIQDGLIDNFVQCLPDRLGAVGTYGKEYYFDYPASSPIARFIMISPNLTFTNGGSYSYAAGTDRYNWVSNTIDNARAAGIKWVIVGMHKVCISIGIMPCDIGNDLFNLLVSKKVDLVLQAHDHDYQRSKQLALNSTTCTAIQAETYNSNCVVNDGSTGNYTQGAGPVVVIVGTIGEGLHTLNTSDGDAGYFAKWMGNNINPTNGLAKFSLSSDQLTVSANFTGSTAPNNFTDSFTITGPTATPTPTPTPPSGISLRAAAIGNNGGGGPTLTIGEPAGTTSGDVMVAHVIVRNAGNTITPPAGWNLVLRQDTGSAIATATYVKVAGSSEPVSYTWSFGTAGEASGGIASYIGVNTSTPVDASHAQYNANTGNVDNTGVTTTTANDMLVYAVGIIVRTTVNVPAGFTQVWSTSSSSDTTSEMSQEIFAPTGATGTIHGTHNGGANSNITMLIALEPAGATTTPTPTPTSTPTPTPTPTSTPTPTPTPQPGGGISLRAAAIGNNGAGGPTLTIGLPAGTTSGDVMVAHIIVQTAGNTIARPAGWNLVLRQDSASAIATATYVKVAGSSEPASYTWSFGTAGQASGGIASYIGVNTSTPVDASHAQYNANTGNVDNTGVTTTTANDMLVYAVGIIVATTVNVPAGFTEQWRASSSSLTTSEMSQEIFAPTGATGTIHGTHNGGANSNITVLIALEPAGTATPTPTPTPQPGGGISLRAAAIGNNDAGGPTLTIGEPAGTTSGDVMVAHIGVRNAGNTITPPAGWNLVLRQDSSSSIATATYVKVAGSSEPASYTWSFGTAGQASGGIASYIGVNTTTPVDASHAQYNANTSNVDNTGVTTTTANDMLVYAVGITLATTVNVPAGFTEQWSTSSSSLTTSEMSQEIFAPTGATGTIHGTLNGGANSNITMLIALEPA
jgi:hypothetical protein